METNLVFHFNFDFGNLYEAASVIISGIATLFAIISFILSLVFSNRASKENEKLQKQLNDINLEAKLDIARRKDVIELFKYWDKVHEINPDNLIGPHVHLAANALELTATLWNFDALDKKILHEVYWKDFKYLYDIFKNNENVKIPGYDDETTGACHDNKTLGYCITDNIKIAYNKMSNKDFN